MSLYIAVVVCQNKRTKRAEQRECDANNAWLAWLRSFLVWMDGNTVCLSETVSKVKVRFPGFHANPRAKKRWRTMWNWLVGVSREPSNDTGTSTRKDYQRDHKRRKMCNGRYNSV